MGIIRIMTKKKKKKGVILTLGNTVMLEKYIYTVHWETLV